MVATRTSSRKQGIPFSSISKSCLARSRDRLQGGAVRIRLRFLVAGLQPTESVVRTQRQIGFVELHGRKRQWGRSLEFVLTKCQEHMSTKSALTPRGQRAPWHRDQCILYFTDQSGDRYLLTVFYHARKTHKLGYNSQAPAIMKIEWNNKAIHWD